ncbi:hypothetical protein Daus18300_000532 [Diaporthe australafricana]|uniref:Uncharacterized protein n=1 Tax=Diaporthe australafricana TaxID=127596 RepID=A0ABR3Y3Q2_9PEZI
MADVNQTPVHRGHEASPFFKLPGEVRNNIYRHLFSGGEMSLVIDPPVGVAVALPRGGRHSVFDTARSFHQFILTCFVAQEAIAIYWAETIIRNGCDGHFTRGYFINRIPAFAKSYIQHLRAVPSIINLKLKWLRGTRIRYPLSLAESLDQFPMLMTCSISDTPVDGEVASARAQNPNVHLLAKTDDWELSAAMRLIRVGNDCLRRVTFQNFSNGDYISHTYLDSNPVTSVEDELCFEQIATCKVPDQTNRRWLLQ